MIQAVRSTPTAPTTAALLQSERRLNEPMSQDPSTSTDPQLLALRDRIDAIDRELLALLNKRAGVAQEVGELKKRDGSPVFRPRARSPGH